MPAPKRENPDDFFQRLETHQQAHLGRLREISAEYVPTVSEELRWNTPAYLLNGTLMWMLQAYSKHCSLRFTPAFFGPHRHLATDAGYDSGEGFLKLPYDRELPEELVRQLIDLRLAEAG